MRRFKQELENLIDEAVERGNSIEELRKAVAKRVIELESLKFDHQLEVMTRTCLVLFCAITPAAIYGLKVHASYTNHTMPDDNLLNWTCLLSILAVMGQSFAAMFPLLDRLLKLVSRSKDK